MTKSNDKNNYQMNKIIKRLKLDPLYQEMEEASRNDLDNLDDHVYKIIATFNLDADWLKPLSWIVSGKQDELVNTGSWYEFDVDPVTRRTRYSIPVKPETTMENVISSYKEIKKLYESEGANKMIRADDEKKTEVQLYAYRKDQAGADTKTIQAEINNKFDEDYELFEISNLIKEGKDKKLG